MINERCASLCAIDAFFLNLNIFVSMHGERNRIIITTPHFERFSPKRVMPFHCFAISDNRHINICKFINLL